MSQRSTLMLLSLPALLAACVVVPVDPRTGQPYPLSAPQQQQQQQQQQPVPLAAPAAAPAPQASMLSARLYPVNEGATRGGMLQAQVIDGHGGRGSFSVNYLGDTLQGEATRVDSGYAAFGRVHDQVLGASKRSFSGQRGIANGYGPRGASVQCEYLITGPGLGTGACLFSDGARYQMHFGS